MNQLENLARNLSLLVNDQTANLLELKITPQTGRELINEILNLRMLANDSWQPISSVPKDGSWVLLWCDFGDRKGNQEPVVARWIDNPRPAGPFGKFSWRDYQDGSIAEQIPTHWAPVTPPIIKSKIHG